MAGFDTDSAGITAAAGVLHDAVDSLRSSMSTVDSSVCAHVGPGRLGAAAAGLLDGVLADLDGVLGAVTEDAHRIEAARTGYTELDETAAAHLRGIAGG